MNENVKILSGEVLEMRIDEAMNMIASGEIRDAKTILLLQYLKLNQIL